MTIEEPGENHLQLNGECSLSSQELCRMCQLQPLDSVMSNHIRPSLAKDLFTDFSNRRVPVQKYKPGRIYWPLVRGVGVGQSTVGEFLEKKKNISGHKPELDVNFCVYWSFLVGRGVELCTTTQIHYMGERDPNQNLCLNASQTTWTLVTFLPFPRPPGVEAVTHCYAILLSYFRPYDMSWSNLNMWCHSRQCYVFEQQSSDEVVNQINNKLNLRM